jgi:hypothetical protein
VTTPTCPACDRAQLHPLAELGEVPVAVGLTYATEAEAVESPRGRMTMHACPECAHVTNVDFDPALCSYDSAYELALFHSPTYARYADELAGRLFDRYGLAGARVLELGGGEGEFVGRLAKSGSVAFASDPAHCEVAENSAGPVTLLPGLVPTGHTFDFVVARFVLEHVIDPYALLRQVRELAGPGGLHMYLEVPDARYDLATAGWDCIYPHVGYFNDVSLRALAQRAGFTVLASGRAFSDQYLFLEISLSAEGERSEPADVGIEELRGIVSSFTSRYERARQDWATELDRQVAAGAAPVLWGAGTRGMMFCNRVDGDRRLTALVDRNPDKCGRFIPITGHRIVSPDDLVALRPRTVIVTNPAYQSEIRAQVADLGLDAELLVA